MDTINAIFLLSESWSEKFNLVWTKSTTKPTFNLIIVVILFFRFHYQSQLLLKADSSSESDQQQIDIWDRI